MSSSSMYYNKSAILLTNPARGKVKQQPHHARGAPATSVSESASPPPHPTQPTCYRQAQKARFPACSQAQPKSERHPQLPARERCDVPAPDLTVGRVVHVSFQRRHLSRSVGRELLINWCRGMVQQQWYSHSQTARSCTALYEASQQ